MKLSAVKLVTIIGPRAIKDELIALLKSAGISGYTYYFVYGGGEQQLRGMDAEEENVKFRVLVPPLVAISLMKIVSEELFDKEKVITFEHDVKVIRQHKFDRIEYGS